MKGNIIVLVLLIGFCLSCNNLSFREKNTKETLDASVDFTTVSQSPSFENCDELLDTERTACFRSTISKHFTDGLAKVHMSTDDEIEETILLILHINSKGKVTIKKIGATTQIQDKLPYLAANLYKIVAQLPELRPANKIGIPVATEYELPIIIKTN